MVYSVDEMILIKKRYLVDEPKEIIGLSYEHEHRRDKWALDILGSAEFTFMFSILISNINYAKIFGYTAVNYPN